MYDEASTADTVALTSTTWPVNARVRLLQVPWDSAYRDVVAWESADERDKWFEAQSGTWFASNFQVLRPYEPIVVPVPYSAVYKYNYIAVTNPAQPVTDEGAPRAYYYFITSVEMVSAQATRLTIQLDVMTTYAGDITYGRAYVERGHIAMANSNARANFSGATLDNYLALPEGLDTGSELVPCHREVIPIEGEMDTQAPKIVIMSTANLIASPGTESSPSLNVADGQFADGLPSGCNVYTVNITQFKSVLEALKDKSWVAQCIVAIYAFPGRFLSQGKEAKLFGDGPTVYFIGETESLTPDQEYYWTAQTGIKKALAKGLGDDADLWKLYTYPYSVIELSTMTGNPVYLKPQLAQDGVLCFNYLACALAPFAKIGLFPRNYGDPFGTTDEITYTYTTFEGTIKSGLIPKGDFLDTAVWITDFPQFSIVNNNYLTYLASTTHTRQYQYDSAGWTKDRANMTADTNYANAQRNIQSTQDQWNNSVQGWTSNVAQQMYTSPIAEFGNFSTPSIQNIVSGLTQGASVAGWNADNVVQNATGAGSLAAKLSGQSDVADNNLSLAQRAAQGDYENAIAGINATVQDAALTAPSTVGQSGGQGFNWKNGLLNVTITYKTVAGAAKSAIADYFRRYGYAVRRFLPLGTVRNMLCMSKFAYWKVQETNITCANANESERETMRGVLEKGVTLWDAPESIGNTDVSTNTARDGYSY